MSVPALTRPTLIRVKRSDLRQKQRAILKQARGRTVVLVDARDEEDARLVLDKTYFDTLLKKFKAVVETLEIMNDQRLFPRILAAARTLDDDMRQGKLRSFEEAFGEK